jgi:small subunit ribosomal protein S2
MECGEYSHCRQWDGKLFTAPKDVFGGEIRMPDLVIFLHTKDSIKYSNHPAVVDSAKALIPTTGIVDSDCNPNLITYPIPGNDDSLESIQLYLHLFKQAILLGKKHRKSLSTEE